MRSKKTEELESRFLRFGVDVVRMTQKYKENLPYSIIDQAIRALTSIGANYSEAQNASSRADFRNKIYIAKKEASESRYWLRVIEQLVGEEAVDAYLAEIQEILLILQKITNVLREKSAT